MNFDYLIKSPCKINLSLDVHFKREDGYHELTSIFQLVDLFDTIKVKITESPTIDVVGCFDCSLEDNLIYKAAKTFKVRTGIRNGFIFYVEKKIPAGGGLGGGSGNCGAVLRLLSEIYSDKITKEELYQIALDLGSDVPFFLYYPTALVEGRGEVISPLETIKDYFVLIVNPKLYISTKEAFQELYNKGVFTPKNSSFTNNLVKHYKKGVNNFTKFKNSFEIAMYSDYTFIKDIKTTLKRCNSSYASLSGSGSTMFGIFTNYDEALKAKKVLSKENYIINLVKPLSEFPGVERRVV